MELRETGNKHVGGLADFYRYPGTGIVGSQLDCKETHCTYIPFVTFSFGAFSARLMIV